MSKLSCIHAIRIFLFCVFCISQNSVFELKALAQIPNSYITSGQNISSNDNIQLQAIQLLEQGKVGEAKKLIKSALCPTSSQIQKKTTKVNSEFELQYLLAFINNQSENYKAVIKDLHTTLQLEEAKDTPNLHVRVALMKRIGDAHYNLRDLKPALAEYKNAFLKAKSLSPNDPLQASLLEAIVGTLIRQGDLSEAESYAKQLVKITATRAASGLISDVGAWFWSQLELLDIYKKREKDPERLALRKQVGELLEQLLIVRSQLDTSGIMPTFETVKHEFLIEYMRDNPPSCLADYLWLALNWRAYTLPLIRWTPQGDITPKAAILCIHGLGLENRAFAAFANEMTKRGYLVYALDIRGFGSWLAIQGQEDLNFDNAIADIGVAINFIKEAHKQVPVFLLGESMGGNIALRAGTNYKKNIVGIVASVPSAERYQQRKMTLSVAMHFLRDKDRPFNIGHSVTQQATSNEELRRLWETDPQAKMNMSPAELIKFAGFMRGTIEKCKAIESTPVFVVQGLKDKLVKPAGTYELFDNVSFDDKIMMIIGNAEHLIFESEIQNKYVIDSLSAWFENRCSSPLVSINQHN